MTVQCVYCDVVLARNLQYTSFIYLNLLVKKLTGMNMEIPFG